MTRKLDPPSPPTCLPSEAAAKEGRSLGMGGEWCSMSFTEAVEVNPAVQLVRGQIYPFVDMQAVEPSSRSVGPSEYREYAGGGSRFALGDTLMARITPCLENGKIARFCGERGHDVGHGSTEFIVVRGREGVTDTAYAYYLTKWEGVSGYAISQMTGTSGRQRVPTETLDHLVVPIPPLPEQRTIAHILGTLDDKIELNRRMNETLEAIARALFKSWFVDATEDGLPNGWVVASFADTVDILGGGTPKTSVVEYWDGDIPWFSVTDAPSDTDVFVVDTEKKITKAGVENSSTQILPKGTTIISARGTVGKVALVGVPMAMNQSCYGLRGKCDTRGYFTYYAVRALVSTLQQRSHGSVFDTITRDTLAGVEVVVPPPPVVEAFEEAVAPILERIRNNLFESRTLAALRDTLLPKLISGELRVVTVEGTV